MLLLALDDDLPRASLPRASLPRASLPLFDDLLRLGRLLDSSSLSLSLSESSPVPLSLPWR